MNRFNHRVSLALLGLIVAFGMAALWSAKTTDRVAASRAGGVSTGGSLPGSAYGLQPSTRIAPQAHLIALYGNLPMSFEANRGQTASRVRFISRGHGYSLFLTPTEAVLSLSKGKKEADEKADLRAKKRPSMRSVPTEHAVVHIKLAGASEKPQISGADKLPGTVNYFIGRDPKKWHGDITTYAKVKYASVYPGVDLIYYGNQGQLEYDFTVAPGANPKQIALCFAGAKGLHLDKRGNLVVDLGGTRIVEKTPVVYQEIGDVRRGVAGGYELKNNHTVGFELARYDRDRPLVIDPVLTYSTYIGGSSYDTALSIALDTSGDAYVTGITSSAAFPTTAGTFQAGPGSGDSNAFVTKLNGTGGAIYSTFLGGSGDDSSWKIAVDSSNNVYVTGGTYSSDFPTTPGAFRTSRTQPFGAEAFVTKLDSTGAALVYSTFLGPKYDDDGGIAVDLSGNAFVTGFTASSNFPTTPGAFQAAPAGDYEAFVTKLNSAGTALIYSTFLGGSGYEESHGIVIDSSGNAYVIGLTGSTDFPTTAGAFQTAFRGDRFDAFVTKLNSTGTGLAYSTYLGGSGDDYGYGIALGSSGNVYVTGFTYSADFPTTAGAFQTTNGGGADAFVTKLTSTGAVSYSTFLGSDQDDVGNAVGVDSSGNALITGYTNSFANFPVTADALFNTGATPFLSKLDGSGATLHYSTYLGGNAGSGRGIAVDSSGNAYVAGGIYSALLPTTAGAFQTTYGGASDAFVSKITFVSDTNPPKISILSPTATIYTLNQPVPSAYTCTDSDDAVTVCNGPVANGANIDTASVGVKTFTVNATDSHNNSTSLGVRPRNCRLG
jgi:Beta-propeller repeat